jgi:hypothetical protein
LLAGCIAVAVMPWNAALWFMWSRLRLAVELDCDERVLRSGAPRRSYGQLLLELSAQRAGVSQLMPAFAFGTSHLEQRLVAMTAKPSRYRALRGLASGSVVVLALAAACRTELPTATDIDKMDASQLASRLPKTATAVYTVDSIMVSKAQALAISPERIGSIAVARANKTNSPDHVNIKLRKDTTRNMVGDTLVLRRAPASAVVTEDSIRVRLRGSSKAQGEPLVVVNGVIVDSFNKINPDNIQQIEIVKGRAAAALYNDPRAASGIILITTKR